MYRYDASVKGTAASVNADLDSLFSLFPSHTIRTCGQLLNEVIVLCALFTLRYVTSRFTRNFTFLSHAAARLLVTRYTRSKMMWFRFSSSIVAVLRLSCRSKHSFIDHSFIRSAQTQQNSREVSRGRPAGRQVESRVSAEYKQASIDGAFASLTPTHAIHIDP